MAAPRRPSPRGLCFVVLTVVWCALPAHLAGQLVDPIIGTWTLNVAKSTFDPGPAAKAGVVRFERAGQGLHVVADLTDANSNVAHTEYTANFDGRDYPIKGVPDVDTVMLKRISINSSERIDKKGGMIIQRFTRTVSPDGKTMTVTQKSDVQGHAVNNVLVFERK
jgi:hypothetical protein